MVPGIKPLPRAPGRRASRGFTLIELLVAITIMAIASAAVVVALRDRGNADLEREALYLASVLESARAEARAASLDVRWVPDGGGVGRYSFTGLPPNLSQRLQLNRPWRGDTPDVSIDGPRENGRTVRLGPEPLIGAQRITLSRGEQHVVLWTDGLSPFKIARGDGS